MKMGGGENRDYSGPGLPQNFLVSLSRTDQTLFFLVLTFFIIIGKAAIWVLIMKISPIEKLKSFFFFLNHDLNADFRKRDF